MMQKYTITQVTADKQLNTRFGPKLKQSCKFKETGDIWHGIWGGGKKVGDVVEGTRESREYEGKTYWEFKFPKKEEAQAFLAERVRQLEFRVSVLEDYVKSSPVPEPPDDYPENNLDLSEF